MIENKPGKDFRVAFVVSAALVDGGASTFESSFVEILENLNIKDFSYTLIETNSVRKLKFIRFSPKTIQLPMKGALRLRVALETSAFFSSFLARFSVFPNKFERIIKKLGIDLVVFLSPNPLALIVKSVPIATTVWDFGHRELPEFPEFRKLNNFREREFYYSNTLTRSALVLVDSETTLRNCEKFYGASLTRIYVLGLLPQADQSFHEIINNQSLVDRKYIFYPAQFWEHKNHKRLLAAFKEVALTHSDLDLVLTGSDKGSLSSVLRYAAEIGIREKVRYLGFVSRESYWELLKGSECLVFASLFGPTNLPPLEAAIVGKRMAIGDFHRNSMPNMDAEIFYFNPFSVVSIAATVLQALEANDFKPVNFIEANNNSVANLVSKLNSFRDI
jgi:glycosyltransferase involved in cell wall biosynthesis